MRKQAGLLCSAVVHGELLHLLVPNDHGNVEVAHLRKLYSFLDEVAHPLALQIYAF